VKYGLRERWFTAFRLILILLFDIRKVGFELVGY